MNELIAQMRVLRGLREEKRRRLLGDLLFVFWGGRRVSDPMDKTVCKECRLPLVWHTGEGCWLDFCQVFFGVRTCRDYPHSATVTGYTPHEKGGA